jgi:hypothetical protein
LTILLLDPEDGGNIFLRNVSELLPDYMTSHIHRNVKFEILTAVTMNNNCLLRYDAVRSGRHLPKLDKTFYLSILRVSEAQKVQQ